MKVWFYCKVPLHVCPRGGKSVHALRSHMSTLKFHTKLSFNYPDDDLSGGDFFWASRCIGGRDAMEEFVSCGVWPLAAGINFEHVKVGEMPVSKLKVLLPKISLRRQDDEDDTELLARVEQEARIIVDSYTCTEHKACIAGLQNNSRLNRVLARRLSLRRS
jgi:hypothetical protein